MRDNEKCNPFTPLRGIELSTLIILMILKVLNCIGIIVFARRKTNFRLASQINSSVSEVSKPLKDKILGSTQRLNQILI